MSSTKIPSMSLNLESTLSECKTEKTSKTSSNLSSSSEEPARFPMNNSVSSPGDVVVSLERLPPMMYPIEREATVGAVEKIFTDMLAKRQPSLSTENMAWGERRVSVSGDIIEWRNFHQVRASEADSRPSAACIRYMAFNRAEGNATVCIAKRTTEEILRDHEAGLAGPASRKSSFMTCSSPTASPMKRESSVASRSPLTAPQTPSLFDHEERATTVQHTRLTQEKASRLSTCSVASNLPRRLSFSRAVSATNSPRVSVSSAPTARRVAEAFATAPLEIDEDIYRQLENLPEQAPQPFSTLYEEDEEEYEDESPLEALGAFPAEGVFASSSRAGPPGLDLPIYASSSSSEAARASFAGLSTCRTTASTPRESFLSFADVPMKKSVTVMEPSVSRSPVMKAALEPITEGYDEMKAGSKVSLSSGASFFDEEEDFFRDDEEEEVPAPSPALEVVAEADSDSDCDVPVDRSTAMFMKAMDLVDSNELLEDLAIWFPADAFAKALDDASRNFSVKGLLDSPVFVPYPQYASMFHDDDMFQWMQLNAENIKEQGLELQTQHEKIYRCRKRRNKGRFLEDAKTLTPSSLLNMQYQGKFCEKLFQRDWADWYIHEDGFVQCQDVPIVKLRLEYVLRRSWKVVPHRAV